MYLRNKQGEFRKRFWKQLFSFKTLVLLWVGTFIATGAIFAYFNLLAFSSYLIAQEPIKPVLAQSVASGEPSVKEWVFKEVESKLGFDEAIKATAIIQCESGWRPDIVIIEPNDTISLGLWQINTVHNKGDNKISNSDKLDYKRATKWAIEKRIRDGNWNAWSCNK